MDSALRLPRLIDAELSMESRGSLLVVTRAYIGIIPYVNKGCSGAMLI